MKKTDRPQFVGLPILLLCFFAYFISSCRGDFSPPKVNELNHPLPEYLTFVAPEPESMHSSDSYKTGKHYPATAHPAPSSGGNRICIQLIGETLLEPGDFFTEYPQKGKFLPDRVIGYVDNKVVDKDEEIITILGESQLIDEGKVIASAPGPQIICWPIELEIGNHYVTVEVNKTSGEVVSYSWSFELIEN